ncbi:hypothetical protein [Candidatus Wolbachia massiliensis]|uniref:Uncharacterized protein n=1 Tax=Candidatus Wolbachia massiliensis TaxID=1845000 RepID=A0A7L7YQK5_9RICK|nr:hypothetical protein [Candidatus Wolbachia massiliensis]QOD37927.1 hypothetical protein ID128_03650 [Candidatus Wolbachia massiliensis]
MTSDDSRKFVFEMNHGSHQLNKVIGYPTQVWYATKKYSVNNTLPIAAFNTWLQFSSAYIAAVIITHNNLSYITDIFNSQLMPAYASVSVILGVVLLASLALRYVYKQEIKDEKSKDGDNPIDIKIRGGESDGINEIAQNASAIEIIPDMSPIGNKKENFSIILPISEKQGEMLENKRQENRNKVILLTVPYALSGLIIAGALARFGFVHVRGWKECAFVAAVSIIAVVGICITLSRLRNNEVNNVRNNVKKLGNVDILLPWRKGNVASVMENKFESEEENNLQSQALKLFERFLTGFKNDVCNILNEQLAEANKLLKGNLLNPSSKKIQETLEHLKKIREDIKKDLDWLHAEISQILNNGKELAKDVGSPSVADLIKEIYSKVKAFNVRSYIGYFAKNEESSDSSQRGNNDEFFATIKRHKEKAEELQNEVKELKKQLEELKNKQAQPKELDSGISSETSSTTSSDPQRDVENSEKKLAEQEKTDEWKEKINSKPSEFLYHVLESIKLEEKDDQENKVSESTLRNFNNKIIIHWRNGSQTICYIEKQGDLPSTKVDFVDKNVRAAFAEACVG